MNNYKLLKPKIGMEMKTVQRLPDGAFIPISEGNQDYQEYLKWLAEGNEPLPADE